MNQLRKKFCDKNRVQHAGPSSIKHYDEKVCEGREGLFIGGDDARETDRQILHHNEAIRGLLSRNITTAQLDTTVIPSPISSLQFPVYSSVRDQGYSLLDLQSPVSSLQHS